MTSKRSFGEASRSNDSVLLEEKKKLRKHFRQFDILFYLICCVISLDTIGSVAKSGAQGFTWLAFLGLVFFIPYGLLAAELGTTFPDEGGPYVWTRMAFGPFIASINTVLYWISNPIWLGGTLAMTTIAAVNTFLFPLSLPLQYLVGGLFIWLTIAVSILSLKVGKWVATVGSWVRIGILSLFTATVVVYALRHGLQGVGSHDFFPSYAVFIAVVPVLVFNYIGLELPSSAGDEMNDPQRDLPAAVAGAAFGSVLLYGLPILAVLLVLPTSHITGLNGFVDAIKTVFTLYGGSLSADGTPTLTGGGRLMGAIVGLSIIYTLATSGATWLMGADRTLAIASLDGAGPRAIGRFSSRFGTPIAANLLSGTFSTIVMVLAFTLSSGDANKYFTAALGLAISTSTISYLAIFPTVIRLRYTRPEVPRPYRIPGGMTGAWLCGGLTTFWTLLATVVLIWPGFGVGAFGSGGQPDDSLPTGFTHLRMTYEQTQILPLLAILILGMVFYSLGKRDASEA